MRSDRDPAAPLRGVQRQDARAFRAHAFCFAVVLGGLRRVSMYAASVPLLM